MLRVDVRADGSTVHLEPEAAAALGLPGTVTIAHADADVDVALVRQHLSRVLG